MRTRLLEGASLLAVSAGLGGLLLARMLGAHWNVWLLFGMAGVPVFVVGRALASWRGWLGPSPVSRDAPASARAHAVLRAPAWLLGAVAVWLAVLPIQVGDSLGEVRVYIVVTAAFGVLAALVPLRTATWSGSLGLAAVAGVFGWDLITGLSGPAEPTVQLASPFAEPAVVFHGGGSPLFNHHAPIPQQHDAVDIVLAPGGSEQVGDPATLEGWACFGADVLAPADGEVVAAVADLPDMPIGEVDRENLVGNHLVVRLADERFLLLAHLQRGSLRVGPGDTVARGQPLARCGNSGNTSQPHLHLQVQTGPAFSNHDPDLRTVGLRWEHVERGGRVMDGSPARRNDVLLPTR